jgi:hypothetical protein
MLENSSSSSSSNSGNRTTSTISTSRWRSAFFIVGLVGPILAVIYIALGSYYLSNNIYGAVDEVGVGAAEAEADPTSYHHRVSVVSHVNEDVGESQSSRSRTSRDETTAALPPQDDNETTPTSDPTITTNTHNTDTDTGTNMNSKPYLIYHIGPPKTGTTTIQDSLRELQHEGVLLKDNYMFYSEQDTNARPRKTIPLASLVQDNECHKEMSDRVSLSLEEKRQLPCWQHMVQSLLTATATTTTSLSPPRDYESSNITTTTPKHHNVLWSYEVLSFRSFREASRWGLMAELLSEHWNVMVIITYRRYYEWLLSAKKQNEKWTASKPRTNAWPPKAKEPRPFHPTFTSRNFDDKLGLGNDLPFYFTDRLLEQWSAAAHYYDNTDDNPSKNSDRHNTHHLSIRVANMHDPQGLVTNFICDVLPHATHTCQASMAKQQQGAKVSNPAQDVNMFYYDVLALRAAKAGFVNTTRYTRREVVLKLLEYHTGTSTDTSTTAKNESDMLNSNQTNQTTSSSTSTWRDFPVVCPSKPELQDFLDVSLEKERAVLPELAAGYQEEHAKKFWKDYENHKFCWLDYAAALKQPEWKEFFQNLWVSSYNT